MEKLIKTVPTTRKEFLEDLINHFNANNRGVNSLGFCSYVSGCAIGRYFTPEFAEKCEDSCVPLAILFESFPEELKSLGKVFLGQCQNLHDTSDNWTSEGLSELGKERVSEIIEEFI